MNVVESFVKVFAPHACLGCGVQGAIVCVTCVNSIPRMSSRCFYCYKNTKAYKTCLPCRRKTGLYQVFIMAPYEGLIKELIHALKYDRAGAVGADIVRHIKTSNLQLLISSSAKMLFSHIPTSYDHIRQRGYDQAQLIATALGKKYDIPSLTLFERTTVLHQTGSKGVARRKQLQGAFKVIKQPNANVILVDDVTTTGATLIEAAKTLHASGVKRVSAYVLAQA